MLVPTGVLYDTHQDGAAVGSILSVQMQVGVYNGGIIVVYYNTSFICNR